MPKKKAKKIRSWNAFVTEMNEKTGRKKRLTRRQASALEKRRTEIRKLAGVVPAKPPRMTKVRVIDRLQVALNAVHWAWSQRNNATQKIRTSKAAAQLESAIMELSALLIQLRRDELVEINVPVVM